MSIIEIVAVIFSFLCTVLAVKKHVLNWPFGIIAVTAYLLLFYKERLYADMILQVIFIVQGAYGWYNWIYNKNKESEIDVDYLTNSIRFIYGLIIPMVAFTWAYFLKKHTNASLPYIDAFAATISLIANWLMAKRKIENWILWVLADAIYIGLFLYKNLYLSAGIYAVFLIIAFKGFIDWNKKRNIKKVLY